MYKIHTILLSVGYLIVFSVLFQIILWVYRHLSLRRKLKSIPGPKTLPFIGAILALRKVPNDELYQWFMDLCLQFKNGMTIIWIGSTPSIHIRKPHQMEVILRSQTLIRKSEFYHFLADWLGNGLLTSTGDVWFKSRRLITPAFHFAILDEFAGIISDKADILNDCIKSQVDQNPKEPVNIYPLAIKFALDMICKTAMGVDMDLQRKPKNEYVKALNRFAELTIFRYFRFWYRSDFIFNLTREGKEYYECIKKMHAFTMKVIHERSKSRKGNIAYSKEEVKDDDDDIGKHKTKKTFLDLLMDLSDAAENSLSLEEIREQVDTLMFGGHDTTGTAITWALFCLGNAPEVQRKVYEELNDVFGNDDKPASKQQLTQLKYLDRVIKEALRFYPSAVNISRKMDHDVIIDNQVIPKGIEVVLEIYHLHHDPEVWEDPETFDPDRFLPENSHGRHAYAYVPFSAGPRNCIGQKFANLVLKIALAAILRKWSVRSALKPSEMKLNAHLVLVPPEETMNLYLTPISAK